MNQTKSSAPTSAVRRNLNVETATNALDSAAGDLVEAVNALEERLAPLLSNERPYETGDDRAEGDSELSERILSVADRVRGRTARIRDLIDRL